MKKTVIFLLLLFLLLSLTIAQKIVSTASKEDKIKNYVNDKYGFTPANVVLNPNVRVGGSVLSPVQAEDYMVSYFAYLESGKEEPVMPVSFISPSNSDVDFVSPSHKVMRIQKTSGSWTTLVMSKEKYDELIGSGK